MNKTNSFQIIKTNRILTEMEQRDCRTSLKNVLKLRGIISLCLDNENLFVEYNPGILNSEKILLRLKDIGFPAVMEIKNVA